MIAAALWGAAKRIIALDTIRLEVPANLLWAVAETDAGITRPSTALPRIRLLRRH